MANRKGVFIGAYVPNELKESLRRRAAAEHRTLSQEITRILTEAIHGRNLPAGSIDRRAATALVAICYSAEDVPAAHRGDIRRAAYPNVERGKRPLQRGHENGEHRGLGWRRRANGARQGPGHVLRCCRQVAATGVGVREKADAATCFGGCRAVSPRARRCTAR